MVNSITFECILVNNIKQYRMIKVIDTPRDNAATSVIEVVLNLSNVVGTIKPATETERRLLNVRATS